MAWNIAKRLLVSLIVIWGSVTLVFFILRVLPGDPVYALGNVDSSTPPEMVELIRHELGLDKPIYVQYAEYIGRLLHGDLGRSNVNSTPVWTKITDHFPKTLQLTLLSAAISISAGLFFGVLSAVHKDSWIDIATKFVSLFSISMPSFWLGILLILVFSVKLGWFPASGSTSFKTLILPAVALGGISSGSIARMVRNTMLEVINDQFVMTLRAKGLAERAVMYGHALKNALIPAVTVIGMQLANMLTGSIVVETVFARRGLGNVLNDAISAKDTPMVQGVVLFTSVIYVCVNLLVDVSYSLIDPRIRRATG